MDVSGKHGKSEEGEDDASGIAFSVVVVKGRARALEASEGYEYAGRGDEDLEGRGGADEGDEALVIVGGEEGGGVGEKGGDRGEAAADDGPLQP